MIPKSYIDAELNRFQNEVAQVISPVTPVAAGADQAVKDLQNTMQKFLSNLITGLSI